jgi:hypothetical protein
VQCAYEFCLVDHIPPIGPFKVPAMFDFGAVQGYALKPKAMPLSVFGGFCGGNEVSGGRH